MPCAPRVVAGVQTARALDNLSALLARHGSRMAQVAAVTVYLKNQADFAAMNEVWDDWVAPGDAPPRATVQAILARPEWKIEVVVTAALWTE